MKVKDFLAQRYESRPFLGKNGGQDARWAKVYFGPFTARYPNTAIRKRILPFHDMHHAFTGYSNSRIGEGEISAWELGTRCYRGCPPVTIYNINGMATGLCYSPRRVYRAFMRGRAANNVYGIALDRLYEMEVEEVMAILRDRKSAPSVVIDHLSFAVFLVLSLLAALNFPLALIFSKMDRLLSTIFKKNYQ